MCSLWTSTFPLAVPAVRQALAALFYDGEHPTLWPLFRHVAVAVAIVSVTFVVSLYLPVLEFVFGLTGATAGE